MASTVPRLRGAIKRTSPSLAVEQELWRSGSETVAGVDEVGRGAWAGPLTVGVAIVPKDKRIYKIRDSKMLTEDEREAMFSRIVNWVDDWAVGHASPKECDDLGMSAAQRLAAERALASLESPPDRVLVDGNWDFVGGGNSTINLIKGDASSVTIAAASILAKVTRDRLMREASHHFPAYSFAANKGYPCPIHKSAIAALGPCTIHRMSWAFMDDLPWNGLRRAVRDDGQERLF